MIDVSDSSYQPMVSDMVVGTAQLGMDYGIANRQGAPSKKQAAAILDAAINNGVEFIDTARAYGNSEAVIGCSLPKKKRDCVRIITKLSPLSQCSSETSEKELREKVEDSLRQSCESLGVSYLEILMLHRADHLFKWNGVIWRQLIEYQESGLIKELGVSVQNPRELFDALQRPEVNYLQMPFNLLETRWQMAIEAILKEKESRNLTVHVRSSMLQGLLVSRDCQIWKRAGVSQPERLWEWLDSVLKSSGCQNMADLCIRYVRSLDWVDGVVVGMESMEQLNSNLVSFKRPLLDGKAISGIEETRPTLDRQTLDPSLWLRE